MPNLLAHYLLAKRFSLKEAELCSNYATDNFQPFLAKYFDYFALGAQGPDPLFYVGIVPRRALHLPTAQKRIGNRIHKTDARKYFQCLIEEYYGVEPEGKTNHNQSRFAAFVFGQFSHYLLDRESHPYVLYESGFNSEGRIKGKYHYRHAFFECQMDYSLAKFYKLDYFLKGPEQILCDDFSVLNILDCHYVSALKNMFGVKLPKKMYSNAVLNMKSAIGYVNKGTPLRAKMFFNTSLAGMRLPKEVKEDVLNEKREKWLHPVTGDEHDESFMEISTRCFKIMESLYHDIIKYGFNYETFERYIDGNNYYGCPVDSKWVYHK